ncbi:MAG: TIGR03936 family radical SAM-associated protein [Eubacterium sp.]|nr:TIGR03936 family radical SAM-associated protein [Eubacterium sp.]
MREVRLIFSKTDRCKYISHLDINRCMSRALSRAGIPLWFTEGFNPHPYMSFSLPLSLGVESYCESVDLRITGDISNQEIKDNINKMLPTGIQILDIIDNFRDSSEIAFSDYFYKFEFKDNESALKRINEVLSSDEIIAEKKAKKGKRRIVKETNLKPFIDKYNISIRDNDIILNIRLAAGNEKNLNPTLLFDTIIKCIDMDFEWRSISRIALLDKEYKIFK